MRLTKPILCAAGAVIVVALLGGAATEIGPWYFTLHKPSWQPPDWLFAPAWTVIYVLTATAAVLVWTRIHDHGLRSRLMALFVLNAVLNVAWSAIFFGLRRPDWALAEAVPFWLSILALAILSFPASRAAGWALMPYLAWVLFASILNLAIVRLNGPFGAA